MENINIVFITHYTELYGANKSLLTLLKGLMQMGHVKVSLIAPSDGKMTAAAKESGIECLIIPFHNEIHYGNRRGLSEKLISSIKDFIKFLINWKLVFLHRRKFAHADIFHTNSSATLFGAYLAGRKPHVWHIREFGWEDYQIKYNFGSGYFHRWLNKSAAVVAISQSIFDSRLVNCTVKNKKVIYNGIALFGNIEPRERPVSSKPIFAVIGHVSPAKGQAEAIEAFRLLMENRIEAELQIIGTGDAAYISHLAETVRQYGLQQNVKFLGHIDNIEKAYNKIGFLLMCSKNEAFGRVTIEAMQHEVIVIGYDNAGTSEIITDGFNGLLYSNGSQNLCEKMMDLLSNPELGEKLIKNAAAFARMNFSIDQYVKGNYSIYTTIMNIKTV